jgi:hypothetical protein
VSGSASYIELFETHRIAEVTRPSEDVQMKEAGGEGEASVAAPLGLTLSDELYCQELKVLQFGRADFKKRVSNILNPTTTPSSDTIPFNFPSPAGSGGATSGTVIPYHYNSSLGAVGQSGGMAKRSRRLAQEVVTLTSSLPLSLGSSVFVGGEARRDEDDDYRAG